jgi:hypothetical protein
MQLHFVLLREYDDFLEDLEEDKMYRQNVNIYKGMAKVAFFACLLSALCLANTHIWRIPLPTESQGSLSAFYTRTSI